MSISRHMLGRSCQSTTFVEPTYSRQGLEIRLDTQLQSPSKGQAQQEYQELRLADQGELQLNPQPRRNKTDKGSIPKKDSSPI